MNTVAQLPFEMDYEDEAAEQIAAALVRLQVDAHAEFMGFGTPVIVMVGEAQEYLFQGWGTEQNEDGWFASRQWLDLPANMWQPDEREASYIQIPALKGVTDFEEIARGIRDAVAARHPEFFLS